MTASTSPTTLVYLDNGKELVVAPGGVITVQSGGAITVQAGATVTGLSGGNANLNLAEIGKGFDNGSSVIATGQAVGYTLCPFAGTITGWTLIGNASGSIVIDVWKAATGNIPTSANSITASAKPTLSSAQQASSNSLTGWTTSVAAGDVFAFSVTSASTVSHVDLALLVTKS